MEARAFSPRIDWPPGLTAAAIRNCPRSLRDDAVQAAWLAHAEGRKPDSAVRALVRYEQKHVARKPNLERYPAALLKRRSLGV